MKKGETRQGASEGRRAGILLLLCAALIVSALAITGVADKARTEPEAGGETKARVAGRSAPPAGEKPQVIAHRAGAAAAPENTLSALERSIAEGADMAEIDVRLTRDGMLAVMHDDNLERTTGVNQNVWGADWDMIQGLDAGSWYSSAFAGETVPTLEEMLAAARGRISLMIELKCSPLDQNLVEETVRLIQAEDMEEQCILGCTELNRLQESKALAPALDTVYIGEMLYPELYESDYIDGYSIQSTTLTQADVDQAHAQGKKIYAWTVNTAEEIEDAVKLGIDGVVTDDPQLAVRLLSASSSGPSVETAGNPS